MIHFREANVDDISLIRDMTMKVWPQTYANILSPEQIDYMLGMMYSVESLKYQIEEKGHQFIIGYDDKEPVAFASFSPKDSENKNRWRLHKIYILPGQQGKGIGKKMVDYIAAEALRYGASEIELNVNRYNPAKTFYEKIGFSEIGQEDIDIGGGYLMNDYIMLLKIKE
ncbi:MAG: GNAT family N-acetyltransferase [Bacteroidetes bacterium]|nr:MAG: GNAT family N-acetyltransferase [Bacteroidota bacterium]